MAEGGVTGKGFVKGDPRINRKGRPKTFDSLRHLAQTIAEEKARDGAGNVILYDGRPLTIGEAILRRWAGSKDAHLQMHFIEVAYGKVPDKQEVTGAEGQPFTFRVVYDRKPLPGEDADENIPQLEA